MEAGEPTDPSFEGDHDFSQSSPENFDPSPHEEGVYPATESMCEACEGMIDHATEAYTSCLTCDSSWCQQCVSFLDSISNVAG